MTALVHTVLCPNATCRKLNAVPSWVSETRCVRCGQTFSVPPVVRQEVRPHVLKTNR